MPSSLNEYLKRTTLFAGFSDRQIADVLATAKQRRFAAGEQIIRRGDEGGRGFYLIVEGRTEVRAGDNVLASFSAGDYFGEMALLLPDTPRTADVVAVEETTCLVITQSLWMAFFVNFFGTFRGDFIQHAGFLLLVGKVKSDAGSCPK